MTTYVYRNGSVVLKSEASPHPFEGKKSVHVMSDLDPFVSPVDGSVIGSRSDRRAHNRRNGVIDTGNDTTVLKRRPAYEPRGIGQELARHFE